MEPPRSIRISALRLAALYILSLTLPALESQNKPSVSYRVGLMVLLRLQFRRLHPLLQIYPMLICICHQIRIDSRAEWLGIALSCDGTSGRRNALTIVAAGSVRYRCP